MSENPTTAVATRTGTDIVFADNGKLQFKTYAAVLDFTGQLVAAKMAPKDKSKEQCAICIAFGMPMGMDPLAAIQNIAVINGMPCVWGDALTGLVMGSGLVQDMKTEYLPDIKDCKGVRFTVWRKGIKEPFVGMFSETMAKQAGLWGKQGPWTQYPVRMMLNRARAFALRDGFPDVLKGIKVAEEVLDTPVEIPQGSAKVSPPPYGDEPQPTGKPKVTAAQLIESAAKPEPEPQPAATQEPAPAAAETGAAVQKEGEPF